jgi:hypothetical protein
MDYARQNYIAQPGDGLQPKDFIRRIGPYDHYIINWGYRVLPQARTPEDERPILDRMIQEKANDRRYAYLPQGLSGVDPRSQTEDIGDDPVRASGFAVANLKRVVPNLVSWTSRPGHDYTDLTELYGELIGMWSQYMGHVVTIIGGVHVDLKSTDQPGAVYHGVGKARQKAALEFLRANVFDTPAWLAPREILDRVGPPAGATSIANRQAGVVNQLLDPRRLGRLQEQESIDPANAYPLAEYMSDLTRALMGTDAAADANRRALQRAYIERLETIIDPPAQTGGGGFGGGGPSSPLLATPNLERSDIVALAKAQVRQMQQQAETRGAAAPAGIARAHWRDLAERAARILDPSR